MTRVLNFLLMCVQSTSQLRVLWNGHESQRHLKSTPYVRNQSYFYRGTGFRLLTKMIGMRFQSVRLLVTRSRRSVLRTWRSDPPARLSTHFARLITAPGAVCEFQGILLTNESTVSFIFTPDRDDGERSSSDPFLCLGTGVPGVG